MSKTDPSWDLGQKMTIYMYEPLQVELRQVAWENPTNEALDR